MEGHERMEEKVECRDDPQRIQHIDLFDRSHFFPMDESFPSWQPLPSRVYIGLYRAVELCPVHKLRSPCCLLLLKPRNQVDFLFSAATRHCHPLSAVSSPPQLPFAGKADHYFLILHIRCITFACCLSYVSPLLPIASHCLLCSDSLCGR